MKSSVYPEKFEMIKSRERALWEYQGAMAAQREEGIVIGEEKERKKAFLEKIESARRFLGMGLSMEQVAQGTGLTVEELQKLK